ncbi:hypothetical protein D3C71_1247040 [compost metagenome]
MLAVQFDAQILVHTYLHGLALVVVLAGLSGGGPLREECNALRVNVDKGLGHGGGPVVW